MSIYYEDQAGPARVGILGLPGVGKTRLAGTFPDPFFIDVDRGAATAHPGHVQRAVVGLDKDTRGNVIGIFQKLAAQPVEGGRIRYDIQNGPVVEVGTVVVDTLDVVQKACKTFEVLRRRSTMNWDDYGVLLEHMTEVLLQWNNLPVHVVVCMHTKLRDSEDERYGRAVPKLVGSLRDEVPDWFDIVLHVRAGQDGQRYVMTQPLVSRGVRYLAKDRHNVLAGMTDEHGIIELPADEDGYPSDTIADAICGLSQGEDDDVTE